MYVLPALADDPTPKANATACGTHSVVADVDCGAGHQLRPGDAAGPQRPQRTEVSYTFFHQQVSDGNLAAINSRADTIQGTFRTPAAYPPGDNAKPVTDFSTVRPAFADPGFEQLLNEQGVTVNAQSSDTPANPLLSIIHSFGPTLLLVGVFIWISARAAFRRRRAPTRPVLRARR
jgi:hypothetical protein